MMRSLCLTDLYAIAAPAEPALSPDGTVAAYTLRTTDAERDANVGTLWTVRVDDPHPRALTTGPADSAPAWSPDGQVVAFLRGSDRPQVWLLPVDGGEPEQLTDLPLGAGAPVWSADGQRLAFTAPVDVGTAIDTDAEVALSAPIVADRLDYKADGSGLARTRRSHLHVVDHVRDSGKRSTRRVTDGDWNAGEPAWHPAGHQLAFASACGADPDLTRASGAYVVGVDEGPGNPSPRLVGSATGLAELASWTGDGGDLLVTGQQSVTAGNTRLLRVSLDGETSDLTGTLDRNIMPGGTAYPGGRPQLTPDGRMLVFCLRDRGCTQAYALDLTTGERRALYAEPGHVVSGVSVAARADRAALVVATPANYGEVVVVDLDTIGASPRTLTSHTTDALPDVELVAPESREFRISDGGVVHGWLLRRADAQAPGPLLLDAHGGPHNAWSPVPDRGRIYQQLLAAQGWSVLLLNPRGSDGYGESFYTAAIKTWGRGDQRDFTEPVDALVAEGIADPTRLAITGYSYGGYTTCHLTASTDRFAAAVAGGVVSDLTSMAGTSDIGHLFGMIETGIPHQDPDGVREQSPIERVANVRTPTLVLHGLADDRCPVSQGEQWFSALRERGVPTRLVLYPGASHLFVLSGRPSYRVDYSRRLMTWLARYVPGRTVAPLDTEHWRSSLGVLARRHRVPGAVLGVLRVGDDGAPDELAEAAYGVLSQDTGVSATVDSAFQIGSITKVWTATMAMQLVDEGKIRLDQPLVEVLPDLDLGDESVTASLTLRHLLTHTSGINGDVFTDTGRGDDYLSRYVTELAGVPTNHPLGATFSYCNAGFGVVGRIIEQLTGTSWDTALRSRLLEPLGLSHTSTLPEEALLGLAAIGHVGEPGEELHVAPAWGLPRSAAPAGLISSIPREVLAFARMHLSGGLAPDGSRVLSSASVTAMQEHQVDLPDPYTLGDSWGLGWIRYRWGDTDLVGHDGNTIGQSAFLRLLPEHGLAVTLLTNGGNTKDLFQDLVGEILRELVGVEMPAPIAPADSPAPADPAAYLGTYERTGARIEVFARDGGLTARLTSTGPLAALMDEPTHEYDLVPAKGDTFVLRPPGMRSWSAVVFYRLADGSRYVHCGGRATPLVSTSLS